MARLCVRLLGPLQVTLDGEPVTTFESDKVRALLAYLVAEAGSPHRRERLAGLLWPERSESVARSNLRVALADLRRELGDQQAIPPYLSITRQTIQLNAECDTWSDIAAFATLLEPASTAKQTAQRLEKAIDLYHGSFMEGFSLPDSAAFEEWLLLTRERLGRQVRATLQRLARHHEVRGAYEKALPYAQRLVDMEPWEEKGQRQAMRLFALTGQRNAALRQYEDLCHILADELGVEPEDETTNLYQRIRDRADMRTLSQFQPHNLPVALIPFVGREKELVAIVERLRDPACRLLTLVGPGGCGKTRLVLEAAMDALSDPYSDLFQDGVAFVPLASVQSTGAIVPAVARALDLSFEREEREPKQQLFEYLQHKHLLLILDNCEHLLVAPGDSEQDRGVSGQRDAVGLAIDMLSAAPGLKILATSRARLNVPGEYLFPVSGMDVPMPFFGQTIPEPQDVAQTSAANLFVQSARRNQPGFELTADNLVDIVRICHLVQGMPLGILLAAAWIGTLAPAEIASEIGRSLDFLETDQRDIPPRQRSMRAVFDHSWRLLTEQEREIFQTVSIFRGGFTAQAFQKVTGASLRQLKSLLDKSLLVPVTTTDESVAAGRYEVHELLRTFAAEKLQASGDAAAAREAHSRYYLDQLHQRQADLKGRRQIQAQKEIETDFDNTRVAWAWSVHTRDQEAIKRSLKVLGLYWMYASRDQEAQELLRQARERLSPRPGKEPLPAWGWILVEDYYRSPQQASKAQLESALSILLNHDDQPGMALCLRALGEFSSKGGNSADALAFYEQSLARYQSLEDDFGKAAVLHRLAQEYRLLGQPSKAIDFARQSLDLSRKTGARFWEASSLSNTGTIAFFTGNFAEAMGYFREANALYGEMDYGLGMADTSLCLARLAFLRRDLDRCTDLACDALEIAEDLGNERITASVHSLEELVAQTLGKERTGPLIEREYTPPGEMPSTIDSYELVRPLGGGAMSTVYLALGPDDDRNVVLKVAVQKSDDYSELSRQVLEAESEILQNLAHPAIPRVYGFGESGDHSYIVIEYIEGESLEAILEDIPGMIPAEKAVDWVLQVGDVLSYLHGQRPRPLIARDVKPGNIMITKDDQARLIDFGIAASLPQGRELPDLGTEGYAPPEQYFGYTDARSDIYALGATLHQLLTGRDPKRAAPFSFHAEPPRSLNPSISEELEAVVIRAVAHDPEARYQDVEEFKTALLACP